jgi:hypothetical protein
MYLTKHFPCAVPHKTLHNFKAYAASIQMHHFASCQQSAQLEERPFTCEAIYYTREMVTPPSVSDVIYCWPNKMNEDIILNLKHHTKPQTEPATGSTTTTTVPLHHSSGPHISVYRITSKYCMLDTVQLQILLTK